MDENGEFPHDGSRGHGGWGLGAIDVGHGSTGAGGTKAPWVTSRCCGNPGEKGGAAHNVKIFKHPIPTFSSYIDEMLKGYV